MNTANDNAEPAMVLVPRERPTIAQLTAIKRAMVSFEREFDLTDEEALEVYRAVIAAAPQPVLGVAPSGPGSALQPPAAASASIPNAEPWTDFGDGWQQRYLDNQQRIKRIQATAWGTLNEATIDEFLEDYEMVGEDEDGRDACYTPSEGERILVKDAILGLLSNVEDVARSARGIGVRSTTTEGRGPEGAEHGPKGAPNQAEGASTQPAAQIAPPRVPDYVLACIHAYGDARADDDGTSGDRLGEAIREIRAWVAASIAPQPAAQVAPLGWEFVLVPKTAPGDEPDWDECIHQAETATGLKVDRHTLSIVIREVRRWLAQRAAHGAPAPQAVDREAIFKAAVRAMPHTNPEGWQDLAGGFAIHMEPDDIVAIWQAAAAQAPKAAALTPSEAVFAFAAWLTCRDEAITFGATHDASSAADVAQAFVESQGFAPPRYDYHHAIKPYPADAIATPAAVAAPAEPAVLTDEAIAALLPGSYYMDPPDGGSVSVLEQLRRMSEDAAKWRNRAAPMTQAAIDVLAERRRQIEVEGWTPEHDDEHRSGAIATAAGCYALCAGGTFANAYWRARHTEAMESLWPWDREWWKPGEPRSNLVRAGALILAEIERLDRKARADAKGDTNG